MAAYKSDELEITPGQIILSGSQDPTITPTPALEGSMFLSTTNGCVFTKIGPGDTDWSKRGIPDTVTLLETIDVGADTSSISFSGLSGDTEVFYFLLVDWYKINSANGLRWNYNGIAQQAAKPVSALYASSAAADAAEADGDIAKLVTQVADTAAIIQGWASFNAASTSTGDAFANQRMPIWHFARNGLASQGTCGQGGDNFANSTAITSIDLTSVNAADAVVTGIGQGSSFHLYHLVTS
ncbi:MAG: hypothetical protein R3322_00155 [Kiloniellales bacterium]|nr:hypothetical protein [Kiloniellales bacterium]